MARRTVLIPPFYNPGGSTTAPSEIKFELTDSYGVKLVGYYDSEGIIGPTTITSSAVEQSIDLATQDNISPTSYWQVTVRYEGVRKKYRVQMNYDDGSNIELGTMLALGDPVSNIIFPQLNQYDLAARVSSGSGYYEAIDEGDLTEEATPSSGDMFPVWTTEGYLRKVDFDNLGGSGNVSKVGTPVDGQIGIWTGNGTIEGDTALTFDTTDDSLIIATSGNLKFGAITVLDDNAGTMTLSNVDALDATSKATIESAIDTLANLTSATSLATVGTIGTGTWQGTAVADGYIASAATWNAKQDALTFGIADGNAVDIDVGATIVTNDYAKFSATGLIGQTYAEVKTDLSLNNVENTALSSWVGTSNITTLGTIGTGTWQGTAVADGYIASAATWNAKIANVIEDTTPQLGGDLDLNGNSIDFPTTANISDCLDEDDMSSDSATKIATQQSIKAYADTLDGGNLKKDGSVALTTNWDAGAYEIRAETFESDVATGTAPLTVASTTVVTNFNADQVDGEDANDLKVQSLIVACSDETTDLTTGTAKVTFRMPYAFTLSDVRASVVTAPTGANLVVDINESGTTILSTKLSIDVSEKTSTTAATAAVISDSSLADDSEITIDIDQVGSTIAGAGLKVTLIGVRT